MTRHEFCSESALPPGERLIVEIDGLSIGVFNIDEEYFALNNACPHQLAPLCKGTITGTVTAEEVGEYEWERDGSIIRCPWHNWEFDVRTGESVFNPHAVRTRTYDVAVEGACRTCDPDHGEYGTELSGTKPPVETYDVEVEDRMVVLYL